MDSPAPADHTPAACRAREILDRVADKWSLSVIYQLDEGTKRFTELKRGIDGISHRMLTVTLRELQRDGIVSRTMYAVMPPRVDYSLTPMGRTLLALTGTFVTWAESNLDEIETARTTYDYQAETVSPLPEGKG